MNTLIVLAALLGPNAAPPIDPRLPLIEQILVTPAESLAAIEKALEDMKEEDAGLPRGWKAEFIRLWKVKGVRRVQQGMIQHLKQNFSMKELKAIVAMKNGDSHPLE